MSATLLQTSVLAVRLQVVLMTIKTHTIILATGADSNWLGIEGEQEYRGGGVSSCATCDGFLYREQEVVVIGGGDTAMEDALVLARTSSKVTVIHRRDSFRASHTLAQRVLQNDKITVRWNATTVKFEGETVQAPGDDEGTTVDMEQLTKVHIKDVSTGEIETMLGSPDIDGSLETEGIRRNSLVFQGIGDGARAVIGDGSSSKSCFTNFVAQVRSASATLTSLLMTPGQLKILLGNLQINA